MNSAEPRSAPAEWNCSGFTATAARISSRDMFRQWLWIILAHAAGGRDMAILSSLFASHALLLPEASRRKRWSRVEIVVQRAVVKRPAAARRASPSASVSRGPSP